MIEYCTIFVASKKITSESTCHFKYKYLNKNTQVQVLSTYTST